MTFTICQKVPTKFKSQPSKTKQQPTLSLNKGPLLLCFALLFIGNIHAQTEASDSLPKWKHERKLNVLLNQSSFHNWLAGGVNNYSGTLKLDYELAYTSTQWSWSTTLDAALGYAKTQGIDHLVKTEDQLMINAILNRKTENAWNFSSSFNLKTQNAPAYLFEEAEDQMMRTKTSAFFSPAYMYLGIGIAHDKGDALSLQFNPLTARVIVVDRSYTMALAPGESFFGVAANKTTRWEAGASFALQSKVEVLKNISLETRLSLITNYLEEFQNIDFDYTGSLHMKVNDYLSALLEVQLLYDDNALADLQTRQVFGLVISLPF